MSTYSSLEVCRRTGFSYRQLDYARRQGLFGDTRVQGVGSGQSESYTDDELLTAAIARVISNALGVAPPVPVLRDLSERAQSGEQLATASPYVHLMIDVEGLRASLHTEHVA
jgi:hypothetical protein